jgi:hypothetical protein
MKPILFAQIAVINTVTYLRRINASGYNGTASKTLKHYVNLISKPFTYICNSSLTSGIYPDRCKYTLV